MISTANDIDRAADLSSPEISFQLNVSNESLFETAVEDARVFTPWASQEVVICDSNESPTTTIGSVVNEVCITTSAGYFLLLLIPRLFPRVLLLSLSDPTEI